MIAALNLYTISLFIHISAAIVGLGATFALSIAFPLALRMKDPRHLLFMHRLNLEVVTKLASPALGIILLTGIIQVIDGDLSFGEPWISATFVIVFVLGGLQGAYFAKTDRKLAAMVESELASGATQLSPEYQKEAQREGSMGALTGLLVLAAVFLMVIKPGA
ncbi:DUF2269 family protein [Solirubrobacter sp. CPCC 204708]|uniref:DUF2269 domain-containing protein n=1 Tax=Solirubrobacter deserti TaxID=2282478 RepID=A0ABT4RP56_9ACTN|nr:DUF2269 family protein [Solirubrobacter deserti]MBE2317527.1 DUF2269 family protein [Solirubrobacter deserti]MDA0140297.1 DUF2269 domain-containing protein [Solirubrobacter deserti]